MDQLLLIRGIIGHFSLIHDSFLILTYLQWSCISLICKKLLKYKKHCILCWYFCLPCTDCPLPLIIIAVDFSGRPQWLRIHLPVQETQVWSLVWEDSTCHRATKPMHHNYSACTLEPIFHKKRSHHNEKPMHHN